MPAIEVLNLTKEFNGFRAVDEISFLVESGELYGLLGPNGAGKTTTINMLATLLRPSSGSVEVAGFDITSQKYQVRRSIGVVFQETALDSKLTGRENLEFHAMMYNLGKSERRQRIGDVLRLVELEDKAKVLVDKYSGGMKRRLEIARGLIHHPKVLFSSTFGGLSVMWDREFGFLKEIMVAPVSRLSIVLGRVAGGVTTSLIQTIMILGVSFLLGFRPDSWAALLPAFLFMLLISMTFMGLGLIFASRMRDMQGFSIVMNFVIFPLFFMSGALYPLENFPLWLRVISYLDPLTYGVDGLRGVLIGVSSRGWGLNLVLIGISAAVMISLGAWFFETSDSV